VAISVVQRTHARIATPREDQLAGAAGPNHLIVDEIGRHTDQRQFRHFLPDDFVPGGKRNEMGETFEGDTVARSDEARDRVVKR